MPKIKTNKSLLKRLKITKSGKMFRRHRQTSHLRGEESTATRARKGELIEITGKMRAKLRNLV